MAFIVFSQSKIVLPLLELIGIFFPFHFLHSLPQSFFLDGPQSMDFLLLALSQTLDFCSKLFFDPLILSMSPKHFSFAPSVGCDPSQGFFLKENISPGSKWDYQGYNFLESEGISKMAFSHFKQGRLEPINFDLI